MTDIRTYSELSQLGTFEERYEYLRLRGVVGAQTFGHERHINQSFYRSREWRQTRDLVISRDEGTDLGIPGYEIYDRIIVHHMNPMMPEEIVNGLTSIMNPEYLISTTQRTHNAIHYGDSSLLLTPLVERSAGDTKMW